jgi:hypothetical protein
VSILTLNAYKLFKLFAFVAFFASFEVSAQMFRNAHFDEQVFHKRTYWYVQENFFLEESGFKVEYRSAKATSKETESESEGLAEAGIVIVENPEMDEALILHRRQRPMWVHGGDSIATAWGTRDTLAERLVFARNGRLRNPDRLIEKTLSYTQCF